MPEVWWHVCSIAHRAAAGSAILLDSETFIEEHAMHARRLLNSFIVAAVLALGLSPIAVAAQTRGTVSVRVYDRSHKDYHQWTPQEDHSYRQYLGDQHMKYRRYSKLNQKQQGTYWTWRHSTDDRK
jgi:hypothetical protein